MLRSIKWQFVTDVSAKPIGAIFKAQACFLAFFFDFLTLEDGGSTGCLETSVTNHPIYTA